MGVLKVLLFGLFVTSIFVAGVVVGVYVVDQPGAGPAQAEQGVAGGEPTATRTPTPTPVSAKTAGPTPTRTQAGTPRPDPRDRLAVLNETLVERLVHERVNEIRAGEAIGRLRHRTDVRRYARDHSRDMAEHDYVAHYGPDGTSRAARFRGSEISGTCQVIADNENYYFEGAENVAYLNATSDVVRLREEPGIARAIVRRWMNADRDRRRILFEHADSEGVGVAIDDGGIYATRVVC